MAVLRLYKKHPKLLYRFKSSSLIEAIVAMVIVSISFGLGVMIYMNIHTSGNPLVKLKAYIEVSNFYHKSLYKKNFDDENYAFQNLNIHRQTSSHPDHENLKILIIKANDLRGKEIYRKRVIVFPQKYE
jgi:hypothetical protein